MMMHQFSDFFNFLEKFFDYSSQKKIHEPVFGTPDWQFRRKDSIILKIHSVIQFFGNYDQKLFFKNCKNH